MFKSGVSKPHWLAVTLLLLYWIGCAGLSPALPDQIPSHWNMLGEINGYTSKTGAALMLPALPLLIYLLLTFLPNIDPRRENYRKFSSAYRIITLTLTVFMVVLTFLPLISALGHPVRVATAIGIMLPLLTVVLGCHMEKIQPNHFIGIRTPWTLDDDENWEKTHRFARKAMVLGGFLAFSGLLFSPVISFVIVISGTVIPLAAAAYYSFWLYKHPPAGKSPES